MTTDNAPTSSTPTDSTEARIATTRSNRQANQQSCASYREAKYLAGSLRRSHDNPDAYAFFNTATGQWCTE